MIRDLFAGKTNYKEFLESPERISTNILSARLKLLVSNGLIINNQANPKTGKPIYQLTDKGRSIYPVLEVMAEWGLAQISGTKKLVLI